MVRASQIIATIESDAAAGLPNKQLAEHGKKFRLAIFAEPLNLVFIAKRAKAGQFSDSGIKPT